MRELAAPPPLTLSFTNVGLFGMIMTTPDSKLDNLLWYIMPNLIRLAYGISNEELARAKLVLKVSICSLYDGNVKLGETMATEIQTIGHVVPLAEALARVATLTMTNVKGGIHKLPDYNWIHRHS